MQQAAVATRLGILGFCLVLGLASEEAKAQLCSIAAPTPAQASLCAAIQDINSGVGAIVNGFTQENVAIQQLSTQSDIQLSTTVISSPVAQRAQVSCVAARRNGFDMPGCAGEDSAATPARATTDGSIGEIGLTVSASWGRAKQDTVDGQTGFKANTPGLVITADTRLAPKLLVGAAVGQQKTNMDFNFEGFDSGHLDSKTVRAMGFVNYTFTQTAYAEATMGYGRSHFDSERLCSACKIIQARNTADFSGNEYLLSVAAGNKYKVRDFALWAYVRGDYLHFTTDNYAEDGTRDPVNGNKRTALEVDSQSTNSFTTVIGGQAAYALSRNQHQLTPRARLEWVHEFADNSRTITSHFIDAPGSTIGLPTASPERNWVNAGIGLDMTVQRAWNLAFDYTHLFKRDASADQLAAKFKYNF